MSLNSSRIFGLDILRAVAILLVMLVHGIYFFTNSWDIFYILKYIPDGVSIFFVLSGFLIGNIIIRVFQQQVNLKSLKNFWIRRWFRTLPAYYFVLIVLIAITLIKAPSYSSLLQCFKYFFFLQAFDNGICRIYMESWSLCVEEFFYLFIPVLLFFLKKLTGFPIKGLFMFCIVLVIVSVTLFTTFKINNGNYNTYEDWDYYIRKTVFTRLNSIMYGFLGSYLLFYHYNLWKYRTIFLITGLGLFLFLSVRPLFNIDPFFNYEQLSLESIATLLLIPKLTTVERGKGLLFEAVTFISRISYSIYLVNYTPFYFVLLKLSSMYNVYSVNYGFIRLGMFLTWSFLIGYLMNIFVERPMMKMRELFSRSEWSTSFS